MAVKKKAAEVPETLRISLRDPGMTSLFRCGIGGLAASLYAMSQQDGAGWPDAVKLGSGMARVSPSEVVIEFNGDPAGTLEALLSRSFRIRPPGLIEVAAHHPLGSAAHPHMLIPLQEGLRLTFLQHTATTVKKEKTPAPIAVTEDDVTASRNAEIIHWYAQQGVVEDLLTALTKGSVMLAGWAYPGASQKHVAYGSTKAAYSAAEALAATFCAAGALALPGPQYTGCLIIIEPNDLLRFARIRPLLTPSKIQEAYVSGPGDAVLAVNLALRQADTEKRRSAVGATTGTLLKTLPWASQQKTRARTITTRSMPDEVLDAYGTLVPALPARVFIKQEQEAKAGKGKRDKTPPGTPARSNGSGQMIVFPSVLRGFIADNLAQGKRWFEGFATARTDEDKPKLIHQYRSKDGSGALHLSEREGLIRMNEHLEEAEMALVHSVHTALRHRFGAIYKETEGVALQTRKNRLGSEKERWRLAFAGAKTPDQVRAALADLWSRAGNVKELQEGWQLVLPLLRAENWRTARDLALVALASYRGRTPEETDVTDPELETTAAD